MKTYLSLIALLATVPACTINRNIAIAPLNVPGAREVPISVKEGRAKSVWVFGFIGPFGNDSISMAIKNAKLGTDGDTMTNVFVDSSITAYPFFFLPVVTVKRTNVYGTLVKYTDETGARLLKAETETPLKTIAPRARAHHLEVQKEDKTETNAAASSPTTGTDQTRKIFESMEIKTPLVIRLFNGQEIKGTYHGLRTPLYDAAWITTSSRTMLVFLDSIADIKVQK